VADVGAAVAAALGRPVEEIAEATTANARKAFNL
jgi:Tat protein secretion system quality control protein TatD with DNase activity